MKFRDEINFVNKELFKDNNKDYKATIIPKFIVEYYFANYKEFTERTRHRIGENVEYKEAPVQNAIRTIDTFEPYFEIEFFFQIALYVNLENLLTKK